MQDNRPYRSNSTSRPTNQRNNSSPYNRGNTSSGGFSGNRQPMAPATLPQGYLAGNSYFDKDSNVIKREYILKFAQELANSLSSGRPELKKTQIRGFYDKVKYAWDRLERDKSKLAETLASIAELAPLAHSSVTKGNAPQLFEEFIKKNVDIVDDYDTIKAFEQHFRAIICYYPETKGKR